MNSTSKIGSIGSEEVRGEGCDRYLWLETERVVIFGCIGSGGGEKSRCMERERKLDR
jgi:hypothetical protein